MCSTEKKQDWYKWLWLRIGGRPWTYITRDSWHKLEYLWILVLLILGSLLGKQFSWPEIWIGLVILTVGFILGHFFWGTKYISNQQGK